MTDQPPIPSLLAPISITGEEASAIRDELGPVLNWLLTTISEVNVDGITPFDPTALPGATLARKLDDPAKPKQ
jgi:hypothetical protein